MTCAYDLESRSEITRLQEDFVSGKVSYEDEMRVELENIESYNKEHNAFIMIFGSETGPALTRAANLDSILKRKASVRRRGGNYEQQAVSSSLPLLGVPFSIKDNIFFSGFRTTAGSGAFRDFIPQANATIVDRILAGGGVVVGKTNLHELALGATSSSSYFGPVRNPKDPSRISGGSSGGSAASVALAKGAFASLGTDTGGSVRIPAALCGVCGFKPSFGFLDVDGIFPLSATLDHVGILTKTATDMAIVFRSLIGEDRTRRRHQVGNRLRNINNGGTKIRLGVPKHYFVEGLDKRVSYSYWQTVDRLRESGEFSVVDGLDFSQHSYLTRIRKAIQLKEAAWFYESVIESRRQRKLLQPDVLAFLKFGANIGMMEYMASISQRLEFALELLRLFDDQVDFLITPTCLSVAPKVDEVRGKEGGEVRTRLIKNTEPFNLSGFPALSLPSNRNNPGALPTAVQLVGRYASDSDVLEAGEKVWNVLYSSSSTTT